DDEKPGGVPAGPWLSGSDAKPKGSARPPASRVPGRSSWVNRQDIRVSNRSGPNRTVPWSAHRAAVGAIGPSNQARETIAGGLNPDILTAVGIRRSSRRRSLGILAWLVFPPAGLPESAFPASDPQQNTTPFHRPGANLYYTREHDRGQTHLRRESAS